MKARFTELGLKKRVSTLQKAIKKAESNVDNLHVKLQKGNRKTGPNCWTISLMPVIDCANCSHCMHECYDLKSDMIFTQVIEDRARNSVIHKADRARYWKEIDEQVKANFVTELRINVGGDLDYEDFEYVARIGKDNPRTMILFFTKNYAGINAFLNRKEFPNNVRPIMSTWNGLKMDNPHHLPQSHVLYSDGKTTAPDYGAYYCSGNCSECAFKGEGCWTLKQNEHVIFKAH